MNTKEEEEELPNLVKAEINLMLPVPEFTPIYLGFREQNFE